MLRFIKSHITNSTEYKAEDLTDFFSYSKISTYGFPQKSSCIAVDEKLGILAIGTKSGRIRIVGAEGIEWSTTIESGLPIAYIYFSVGTGVLIVLCDDLRSGTQSFYRCKILDERLRLERFNSDKIEKQISCCEFLNKGNCDSALLIGTTQGNVYALKTSSKNLSIDNFLNFESFSITNLIESNEKLRRIDKIVIQSTNPVKIFLLFFSKLLILYNVSTNRCEYFMSLSTPTINIAYSFTNFNLYCGGNDGSLISYHIESVFSKEKNLSLYGSVKLNKISKLICTRSINNEDLIAFTGGVPNDLYGDRFTLTLLQNKKILVLDFESSIIDFTFLNDESGKGIALFILCKQELSVIDIQHEQWLPFSLPYFNPIHSSPVTSTAIFSRISDVAFKRLCNLAEKLEKMNRLRSVSSKKWPLKCGSEFLVNKNTNNLNAHNTTILLTGHENGSVHFWLTSNSLKPWISCYSAAEFNNVQIDNISFVEIGLLDKLNPENLPLRKAGLYDSFCDDYRLAITKFLLDIETGHVVIGGRSGQVLAFEPSLLEVDSLTVDSPKVITVDMTSNNIFENNLSTTSSNNQHKFCRNKEVSPILPRSYSRTDNGFVLVKNSFMQFKPAVQITAVAFHSEKMFLAAGNEFGYAVLSLITGDVLIKQSLLTSQEIMHISSLDGTFSRFKSVKKSIRQSFRRKKRLVANLNETNDDDRNLCYLEECRPIEREIVQRVTNPNISTGEIPHSLVKVLKFCRFPVGSNFVSNDYLFVGTHGSVMLIHQILNDLTQNLNFETEKNYKNNTLKQKNNFPLIKEIRLRHGAPIVNIEVIQDYFSPRVLIYTEEQIRAYALPTFKPLRYKCQFTAVEGSRIRKANIVYLKNIKSQRNGAYEQFIGLITNRGEVYILSFQNPRKFLHVPFTRSFDAAGIESAALSMYGELFYLKSGGSEFQRASIAAVPNYIAPSPFRNEQFFSCNLTR